MSNVSHGSRTSVRALASDLIDPGADAVEQAGSGRDAVSIRRAHDERCLKEL